MLRALASRGHEIDLVREPFGDDEWPPFVLALADACSGIRLETLPATAKDAWWELAMEFRRARFFLRFLGPAYRHTPALVQRARKRARRSAVRLADHFGRPGRWLLTHLLDFLEPFTRTAEMYGCFLSERRRGELGAGQHRGKHSIPIMFLVVRQCRPYRGYVHS